MRDRFFRVSRGRQRGAFIAASLVAGFLTFGLPGVARADNIDFLKEKLRESDSKNDVRVRTSAALALGNTNNAAAGDPLCGALGDSSEVVRQAAAVALKRLNRTRTLECLKSHEPRESDAAAKIAITRAIESISSGGIDDGGGHPPVKNNPNAKYYIALSTVSNATSRAQSEVERIVHKSMRDKLDSLGTVQMAPPSEAPDKAREVIKGRHLKGIYLSIAVDRFEYSGGDLRVKIKLGVCAYPGKNLIGSLEKSLTARGVSTGDKASEDRLLELAAGLAVEQFEQNASAFL